jgi:membrane protease YdiL (CAAX protease family)
MAAGMARWEPTKLATVSWQGFLYTVFMLALGVIAEELFFRGYGFQVALPVAGPWGALIPMALLFAYVHTGNLNSSGLSLLNTFAWGVLLGYAVLRSGDLWLAIGMHAGWNWILPILGVNLSGFTMKLTGYDVIWALPDAWSGGAYGPEGGLICTLVVPVLALVLWKLPLRTQPLLLLRRPA